MMENNKFYSEMPEEEKCKWDIDFITDALENNSWCNCSNFPFNKCDECKMIFYDYENRTNNRN